MAASGSQEHGDGVAYEDVVVVVVVALYFDVASCCKWIPVREAEEAALADAASAAAVLADGTLVAVAVVDATLVAAERAAGAWPSGG